MEIINEMKLEEGTVEKLVDEIGETRETRGKPQNIPTLSITIHHLETLRLELRADKWSTRLYGANIQLILINKANAFI